MSHLSHFWDLHRWFEIVKVSKIADWNLSSLFPLNYLQYVKILHSSKELSDTVQHVKAKRLCKTSSWSYGDHIPQKYQNFHSFLFSTSKLNFQSFVRKDLITFSSPLQVLMIQITRDWISPELPSHLC